MDENEDPRSADQKRYDAIADQINDTARIVRELAETVRQQNGGNVQTVIHQHSPGGWVAVVCAALAFCCLLGVLGIGWMVSVELGKQTAELHDLHAWRDVHSNSIGGIDARLKVVESQRK